MTFFNDTYAADISAKAKTTLIPGLDWQDIAQELDIALWRGLPKYQGRNKAQERTFAQRVMRNRILDLAKSANRQKRYLDSNHLLFSEIEAWENGEAVLESAQPVGEILYG